MDMSTIGGLLIAALGIIGGLLIEGGSIFQIMKPTAAMIVLGGTAGSVMVSFPLSIILQGAKAFIQVFFPKSLNPDEIIQQLGEFSTKARKEGVVALEADAKNIADPFFKKAVMMAVDGADPKELTHTLETQLGYINEYGLVVPKVWEAAGGFAPTIGIIGAVMGLIQVMKNLENIEEVGNGIATAFVATIYGVAFANILFLPAAAKLTLLHKREMVIKEMLIEGVVMVIEGVNPMVIKDKLSGYLADKAKEVEAPPAAG